MCTSTVSIAVITKVVGFVHVQMYIDAQYTHLKLPVDIVIGTVPLRQSMPSVAPVVPTQSQTIITQQPLSAPPINQPDNFDIRMSSLYFLVCANVLKLMVTILQSLKRALKLFEIVSL